MREAVLWFVRVCECGTEERTAALDLEGCESSTTRLKQFFFFFFSDVLNEVVGSSDSVVRCGIVRGALRF